MESIKHFHVINGLQEEYIFYLGNRQALFKNDIYYLFIDLGDENWYDAGNTLSYDEAMRWLQKGSE